MKQRFTFILCSCLDLFDPSDFSIFQLFLRGLCAVNESTEKFAGCFSKLSIETLELAGGWYHAGIPESANQNRLRQAHI